MHARMILKRVRAIALLAVLMIIAFGAPIHSQASVSDAINATNECEQNPDVACPDTTPSAAEMESPSAAVGFNAWDYIKMMLAFSVVIVLLFLVLRFLKKQTQRKDYRYLRLSGENQAEQYVMLYGLYGNQDQAKAALAATNFGLPKSAQAHVAALSDYQAFVNDMGSDELGLNKKLYEVKLRPVALPRVDESVLAEAKRNLARQQALTRTTPRQVAVPPQ